MYVLGVDPAIRASGLTLLQRRGTRWCYCDGVTVKHTDVWGAVGSVASAIRGMLYGQMAVDLVSVEDLGMTYHGHATRGTTSYAASRIREVSGGAMGAACALDITAVAVAPMQWRKLLGLARTAKKCQVRRAVLARVGGMPDDSAEHCYDAAAIAIAGSRMARI